MLGLIKKKINQLFCKHKYISKEPWVDPNTWDWINKCGKCGAKKKQNFKAFGK